MKLQLTNIVAQFNNLEIQIQNMQNLNIKEQMQNLGIQIINTGIQFLNISSQMFNPFINDDSNFHRQISDINLQLQNFLPMQMIYPNINMNMQNMGMNNYDIMNDNNKE